jgi:hypothetical protein
MLQQQQTLHSIVLLSQRNSADGWLMRVINHPPKNTPTMSHLLIQGHTVFMGGVAPPLDTSMEGVGLLTEGSVEGFV